MIKRTLFAFCIFLFSTALFANDFDKMKALAGEWEGTTPEGKVSVTFELISDGTALMERMVMGEHSMVTVYHPDGENLLMTHYCSGNNQPRMRAASMKDNKLNFSYVDASNLKGPDAGRMNNLEITFVSADRIVEKWSWKEPGKDHLGEFHLMRKK